MSQIKTRFTEMFGVEYPIMQGGMQWVATADLVSAVSNAGGLGVMTALTQETPEALYQEIRRCQEMTDRPFAVNLTFLPAMRVMPYEEYIQAIIDTGVRIVETAGNSPKQYMSTFKEHDIKVIHKCTSVRHALSAQNLGVDAVTIDGYECAGHPGEDIVTSMILLPLAADALDLPIIAAGGYSDSRSLVAALSLGADAVCMGTRFMCTQESPIHHKIKEAIVESDESSTDIILRPLRNSMRVARNKISQAVVQIEADEKDVTFEDVSHLVAGKRGRQVYETGDPDYGIWSVGMVQARIEDIPTCDALVSQIVEEATAIINDRLHNFVS